MVPNKKVVFDPYMVKAISTINAEEIFSSLAALYPEFGLDKNEYIPSINKWLKKLKMKPGTALSTGGRNSERGVLTCSLLDALGVKNPRGSRNRHQLAWSIMASPVGRNNIGKSEELDSVQPDWVTRWLEIRELTQEENDALLSQEQVLDLPLGTKICIKWNHGDGPFLYTLGRRGKFPFAEESKTCICNIGRKQTSNKVFIPLDGVPYI